MGVAALFLALLLLRCSERDHKASREAALVFRSPLNCGCNCFYSLSVQRAYEVRDHSFAGIVIQQFKLFLNKNRCIVITIGFFVLRKKFGY